MVLPILAMALVSFAIAFFATAAMRSIALRLGFVDKPGGRKIHPQAKPLGGGVAIFLGIGIPLALAIAAPFLINGQWLQGLVRTPGNDLAAYISGARQQAPLGIGMLLAMLAIHLLGLRDDRKALGPMVKLVVQLAITAALVASMELMARQTPSLRLRILTVLDTAGMGAAPSIILTVLWIAAITNAFNFLDNMDGLSAGIAAVCASAFLVCALSMGQWFVAGALTLLIGSLLGFLCFNFAPASIFMGDSGSLLIGLVLGILTVRTTYLPPGQAFSHRWYALLAPVIVLALPLYDLIVVSAIRLYRGKSPFVGDTNHFSHRLVARGMSRRTAVLCLYLIAGATSIAAILLPRVQGALAAMLILVQTVLVLCVVGLLEQHPLPPEARGR